VRINSQSHYAISLSLRLSMHNFSAEDNDDGGEEMKFLIFPFSHQLLMQKNISLLNS
jgi:hypothetical protein